MEVQRYSRFFSYVAWHFYLKYVPLKVSIQYILLVFAVLSFSNSVLVGWLCEIHILESRVLCTPSEFEKLREYLLQLLSCLSNFLFHELCVKRRQESVCARKKGRQTSKKVVSENISIHILSKIAYFKLLTLKISRDGKINITFVSSSEGWYSHILWEKELQNQPFISDPATKRS